MCVILIEERVKSSHIQLHMGWRIAQLLRSMMMNDEISQKEYQTAISYLDQVSGKSVEVLR